MAHDIRSFTPLPQQLHGDQAVFTIAGETMLFPLIGIAIVRTHNTHGPTDRMEYVVGHDNPRAMTDMHNDGYHFEYITTAPEQDTQNEAT
jgi:hypothetical protein